MKGNGVRYKILGYCKFLPDNQFLNCSMQMDIGVWL